jgi:6-pyruvoyltetrahydropterin/6-carboxytetrahydropterin synthase
VAARVPTGENSGAFGSAAMEAIVMRTVIDRFDHRHLNVDCPEFAKLNPSVENIAMVCHRLLAPELAAAGVQIDHVTVWETEKTSATYPVR